jgi:molybdopterin-binding protein
VRNATPVIVAAEMIRATSRPIISPIRPSPMRTTSKRPFLAALAPWTTSLASIRWPCYERLLRAVGITDGSVSRGKNEMKISARNFLEGKIKEVRKSATTAHVEIELKGGETVISSITNEAVEELGLKKGTKAYAVIKASDVMIAIE